MRGRPVPLDAFVSLPRVEDDAERRARFRQALTYLGQSPRIDRPPPLDGIDIGAVLQSCRVALDHGLLDDLDWIGAEQALLALYELTTALPPGTERRELGKRVVHRVYGGPAGPFVAVAQRMAWSGVKQLETAPMRARVSLSFSLPIGTDVNVDPLALALVTGRERLGSWLDEPSVGQLPARRLAARILERAAHEAVRRSMNGDPYSLEWLTGPEVRPILSRLLADREPLVWRHAAIARGLLSASRSELREEIDLQLDPSLSATEWRRAIVSLVACLTHDSDTALLQCRSFLSGNLVQRHPALLATALWGLPPVIDADPDVAEDLVDRIAQSGRRDVAEELAALRSETTNADFAQGAAQKLAEALTGDGDPELDALSRQCRARLLGQAQSDEFGSILREALRAFESEGTLQARTLAEQALDLAHRIMTSVEAADAAHEQLQAFLGFADLGSNLLETSRLADLLMLGRRPGDSPAAAGQLGRLMDRLGNYLHRSELDESAAQQDATPGKVLMRRRKLVVLLHLLDTQSGEQLSDDNAKTMRARLRAALLSLIERIASDPDPSLHRVLCAALARSFDAAVREELVEPSDLLLLLMSRIDDQSSIRAIAEGATDGDMRQCLTAYDEFLSALAGDDDDLQAQTPAHRCAYAFTRFSASLADRGAYRGEALRQTLQRIGRALDAAASARALSELVSDEAGGRNWIEELEHAVDALELLVHGALARVRGSRQTTRRMSMAPSHGELLSSLIEREVTAGATLLAEPGELVGRVVHTLPATLTEALSLVLDRLPTIPSKLTSQRSIIPLKRRRTALPDWLLPRRTIGGFYVMRALGTGGVSTVFEAKRIEERKNAGAETYALKIPHYDPTTARSLSEQEFIEMFRDEAGALLSLPSHTNLSGFVTFDMAAKPKPILVMELIAGQALEKLIVKRALTAEKAFLYLDGILAGMAAMHSAGVAHLDIKPSNVILRDENTPVLVDFGLSGRQLRPGCGTLEYCAPEILGVIPEGHSPSALHADVYAFACTAYEMLTGQLLFDADSEASLMSLHLSHDGWPEALAALANDDPLRPVAAVLGACLRRDPRNRPSVHEVRAAFQKILRRIDVTTLPWPVNAPRDASELTA